MSDETEYTEQFTIKFDVAGNSIDSTTLVDYLFQFNTIIQEINRDLEPDQQISIAINATDPGSFTISGGLRTILSKLKPLFTSVNAGYLISVLTIYAELIEIKKSLIGENPATINTEGNSVSITDVDGGEIHVDARSYKIYINNTGVNTAISKQFETLEADPEIKGVSMYTNDHKEISNIDRSDFDKIKQLKQDLELNIKSDIVDNARLNIIKLSFDPKLKSIFYFEGNKISAYIHDDIFYTLINKGESFSKGDCLIVQLKINKHFDPAVNTFIVDNYDVTNVVKHVPRSNNEQLAIE